MRPRSAQPSRQLSFADPPPGGTRPAAVDLEPPSPVAAPKAVQAHPRGAEDRRTLTVAEAARILGIGRTKAYELAARNALPVRVIRLGRRLLVSRVELEAFLRGGDTAQPVQDGQPGAPGSGLTVDAPRVAV